ncbi:hypothetical protein MRB53_014665 [Persea americana]|uniref:Uncharacterized protein n=1 Tax=Persea americana TaxID=3435 RepID=A0ACC2KBX7_PERAE|nr:hypothetical protein MRB53_014665 [Persea americana]
MRTNSSAEKYRLSRKKSNDEDRTGTPERSLRNPVTAFKAHLPDSKYWLALWVHLVHAATWVKNPQRKRTHCRRQSSPASPSPRSPPISTQQQPLATHLPTSPSPRRTQNPSPCISLHHHLHRRQSSPASPSPCITTYTQNAEPVKTHLPASPLRSRHSHHPARTHLHRLPSTLSSSPSQPISIASHQRSAATPRNPSPCITVSTQNASCTDPSPLPPINAQQQPLGSPSTTHQKGVAKRTQESQLPLLHVAGYERM